MKAACPSVFPFTSPCCCKLKKWEVRGGVHPSRFNPPHWRASPRGCDCKTSWIPGFKSRMIDSFLSGSFKTENQVICSHLWMRKRASSAALFMDWSPSALWKEVSLSPIQQMGKDGWFSQRHLNRLVIRQVTKTPASLCPCQQLPSTLSPVAFVSQKLPPKNGGHIFLGIVLCLCCWSSWLALCCIDMSAHAIFCSICGVLRQKYQA